jgi:hypothetical protein
MPVRTVRRPRGALVVEAVLLFPVVIAATLGVNEVRTAFAIEQELKSLVADAAANSPDAIEATIKDELNRRLGSAADAATIRAEQVPNAGTRVRLSLPYHLVGSALGRWTTDANVHVDMTLPRQ